MYRAILHGIHNGHIGRKMVMNIETKSAVTAAQRLMTVGVLLGLSSTSIEAQSAQDNDAQSIDRTVLPLREPYRTPVTTLSGTPDWSAMRSAQP